MKTLHTILVSAVAAAMLSLAAPLPALAQDNGVCLTDQQIQDAIRSGQIKSWPKIKKLAGLSDYQEVSDVEVCLQDGIPYYYVNVVSPEGEAMKMIINAIDGSH